MNGSTLARLAGASCIRSLYERASKKRHIASSIPSVRNERIDSTRHPAPARAVAAADLERRAAQAASGFEHLGIGEGDVVALMLRNAPAYLEAMLACRMLGAYYCPINWHFKADEAGFILRDSGAKALAVHADLLAQIEAGLPIGLPIVTVEPGMRAFVSAPLYHSAPNLYALQVALNGALLVVEPRFDAEATLALIERYGLTNLYLVPTMFVRLLRLPAEVRQRYDISSVRFISSTGSPCAPELKRAMIDWFGPVITESYASSEAGHITFIDSREWLERPGSVGRPLGDGVVKILDDDGRALPAGEIGLIYCRQPAYPDFTYTNNPAARAAIERDGLCSVGDMGYLDAAGYLYVADRKSDMVISGGVNIYPAEIEAALMSMPGVGDCAVFGIPDAEFGEALAAAVQLRPGARASPGEVQQFLRSCIANYKVPRIVSFHDALPREESGKIFKRLLREPYWAAAGRRI